MTDTPTGISKQNVDLHPDVASICFTYQLVNENQDLWQTQEKFFELAQNIDDPQKPPMLATQNKTSQVVSKQ